MLFLAFLPLLAAAFPAPPTAHGQSMRLSRRGPGPHSLAIDDLALWAKHNKDLLATKYNPPATPPARKRAAGLNLIVNQNADSSFFGSLALGTPPVSYNVILDTGSSDLWLASSSCLDQDCSTVPTINPAQSSSFTNLSRPFSIQYGSGAAAGSLGQDVVQMAGFSVPNQAFGVCDQVSQDLLNSPVSGLMGLAWQSIASSGATPFWQTLAQSGQWDQPLMAFQLTRYNNDTHDQSLEAGGTLNFGTTNSSLYTGDINFNDIPSADISYWVQTITSITVQGAQITVPTGTDALAAIDTGTTLVGGPSASIQAIYAQIPGSQPGSGNFEGYWFYPCDTTVNIAISFGGPAWPISPADFRVNAASNGLCMGAFFEMQTGSSAPAWIVGDTFLKNVYSVFRASPPSVGFAALSPQALAMDGNNAQAVPSATIGSAPAVVSATGAPSQSSGAAAAVKVGAGRTLVLLGAVAAAMMAL